MKKNLYILRCVLGDGVQIQDNVQLPPETWLVSQKPDSGFSDDEDEEPTEEENNYGPKAILFKVDLNIFLSRCNHITYNIFKISIATVCLIE